MQLVKQKLKKGLYTLTSRIAGNGAPWPVSMQRAKKGLVILALSLTGAALLAPLPAAAEWPMFLKDPNHSSYAEKSPMPPLNLKWKFETKGPIYSSPVISGGKLFVGSYDHNLYAVDAGSGKQLWKFETGGEILSTPAVSKGVVYFGSKDSYVYAVNAADGKQIWKHKTGGRILTSPVVGEDTVFIGSSDLYLYALDSMTGRRKWRLEHPDYSVYSGIYSSPAYLDGAVYSAGKNGTIYSSSAKSGGRNWHVMTNSAIYSSPAISEGTLYIASGNRVLYAIDIKTGKYVWRKDMSANMVAYASPVVAGPRLYVTFKNGHIKSLNKKNGSELKDFKLPGGIYSTPAVTGDGTIFVGCDDGYLYSIDTWTGLTTWKYKTGGGIHSSPAVLEKNVYIGSRDGAIYAFEGW